MSERDGKKGEREERKRERETARTQAQGALHLWHQLCNIETHAPEIDKTILGCNQINDHRSSKIEKKTQYRSLSLFPFLLRNALNGYSYVTNRRKIAFESYLAYPPLTLPPPPLQHVS